MAIFCGSELETWARQQFGHKEWIFTAPQCSESNEYPIYLDILSSLLVLEINPQIKEGLKAIVLSWEDLQDLGFTAVSHSFPRKDDIKEQDDNAIESFLLSRLVYILAGLAEKLGLFIRLPQQVDESSLLFLQKLLKEASNSSLLVCLELAGDLGHYPFLLPFQSAFQHISHPTSPLPYPDPSLHAHQLLAVVPHGLPMSLIQQVVGQDWEEGHVCTCTGPEGKAWAFLPQEARKDMLKSLEPLHISELNAAIFDSWPSTGYGYIQKSIFAWKSKRWPLIQSIHTPYLHGMVHVGTDFIYRHLLAFVHAIEQVLDFDPLRSYALYLNLARIAPRVRRIRGYETSIHYYKKALTVATDNPAEKVALYYDLANTHAVQKHKAALTEARQWYKLAFEELEKIEEVCARAKGEVRLLNGIALVEYHQKNNEEALRLEKRAMEIAQAHKDSCPELESWAIPLLNTNTAKLLAVRFDAQEESVELLKDNYDRQQDVNSKFNTALSLARIEFDKKNYGEVAKLLQDFFKPSSPQLNPNDSDEIWGRLMLAISLAQLKDAEGAMHHFQAISKLNELNTQSAELKELMKNFS